MIRMCMCVFICVCARVRARVLSDCMHARTYKHVPIFILIIFSY